MNRQRLLEAALWLLTLFCIAMMFLGPLDELMRRLRSTVEGLP